MTEWQQQQHDNTAPPPPPAGPPVAPGGPQMWTPPSYAAAAPAPPDPWAIPQEWSQSPGAPPSYGAPQGYGYPYGYAPARPTLDKGARNSLILGIFGIFCLGVVFGPAAVIEGVRARGRIRVSQGRLTGDGLALGGIILGCIVTVLSVIGLFMLLANSGTTTPRVR